MPASRPRIVSGMVWFQIVARNRPLTMSAAPASTRHSIGAPDRRGQARESRSRRRRRARPITIARPWWCTCDVHPEVAVASMLPTVSAV